jgi:hypothetical protein
MDERGNHMNISNRKMTRREMLKVAGLTGLASALGTPRLVRAAEIAAQPAEEKLPQVPRRVLGKTGQSIPILLMGGSMSFDQRFDPKLAEALRFGVNYFDTAYSYAGGASETGIGNFLERSGRRKETWITTKSMNHTPDGMANELAASLQRLKTDHVDLFFLHALKDGRELTPEMAQAADKLKKDGKIRFFGFSCHDGTVVDLLNKAATLPWIDAIMFRYNFREYGNKDLNDAMDACHKSNIGLIAMKTQGSAVSFDDRVKKFDSTKFTHPQAVLKAVWADERITAAVSQMDALEKIKENVAAAVDPTKLSEANHEALQQYAQATQGSYCAGCDHICGQALPKGLEVGTTLRYLMYHDVYRDPERARALFAQLPAAARQIEGVDFTQASALCPHKVDIAKHMERAVHVLA